MFQGFLRSRRGALAVLAAGLMCLVGAASGCASRRPLTLADRFVLGTSGPVEMTIPRDALAGEIPAGQSQSLPPAEPVAKTADQATLELQDAALKASLASLHLHESVEALRQLASEYLRLGVFDQAEAYASRALAMSPADAVSFDLRARVRRDWDAPELALLDAHRAVFFDPKSASAHNTLGTVLFALGQPAAAAREFEAALALDPKAAWAQSNLCYVSLMSGDEAVALSSCAAAIKLDPTLSVARNNLGLVHAAAGRVDDAQREFMAGGSVAAGYYNLGVILMARQDYARAGEAFAAAGRAQPSLEAAFTRAREARLLAARAAAGGK